ncbi:MAG: hypothetical protein A2075_00780 [Geobacteraceae bacterium GWC2_58_44]|nr:MAG: hypothetical protein A2075_00780 [Geobacteraceae bacterium GWC2_58_44]HBG06229.1 hypothetical protein [Geobacter sp.]
MDDDDHKKKKKVEQNDPNGAILKSQKPDLLCGGIHQISIYQPSVIIDSHMHIQSGNCAPLPFLHDRTPVLGALKLKRATIEVTGEVLVTILDFILLKPAVGMARKMLGFEPDENGEYYRKGAVRQMVPESKMKTFEVGADFITKSSQAYEAFSKIDDYKDLSHLVLSGIVMTMDMEYAHIDGYFGIQVYNAVYDETRMTDDPIHYWYPRHGFWTMRGDSYKGINEERPLLPVRGQTQQEFEEYKETIDHQGITGAFHDIRGNKKLMSIKAAACLVPDEETVRYEQWTKQVQYTEQVVLGNPLKLLPMFHYDPRRWQLLGNSEVFKQVDSEGIYLGFKMYTAQGYRPWDPRLPILEDFYAGCCKRKTPIMNHCTPDGAPSFNREEYFDFVHPNDTHEDQMQKDANGRNAPIYIDPYLGVPQDDPLKRLKYFNEQFVSPDAWRLVLDKTVKGTPLNSLHLCLAHFGGNTDLGRVWGQQIVKMITEKKYPNLYVDISSSFTKNSFREYFRSIMQGPGGMHLKDRILFGTDWYLTLLDGINYVEYCQEAKKALDEFDTSLWPKFTQHNPYRFYRLDKQIDRITRNIIARRQSEDMKKILPKLKQKEIDLTIKEANYIKLVNKPYLNYEEWPCDA